MTRHPLLPLGYLACAAVAFLLATMGSVWLASDLAGHYYHPRLLALTHLVTLGWITVAIMGASYQLVPVVLERPIWSERLAGWQLAVVAVAMAGMVSHFALGSGLGLASAAGLLAVGIALHLLNVGLTFRQVTRWTFTARLILLGHGGLALTTLFGVTLAFNRVWRFLPDAFFPILHAHLLLALFGWVAPMVLGVSARVYPMFLLAPEPSRAVSRVQLWTLALGVPAVVLGVMGRPRLLALGGLALALTAGAHVASILAMVRGRKRPQLDWSFRFVVTATAFLLPAAVVGVGLAVDSLAGPRPALAFAVLLLGGWISLTIVGMMLKIVPFLVWSRVYGPRAGREPMPTLAQLSSPRAESLAYALLASGLGLLAATVWLGDVVWIRGAGALVALGALAFATALARILGHLRSRSVVHVEAHAR